MIALLVLMAQAAACVLLVRSLLPAGRGGRALQLAVGYGLWAGVASSASTLALRWHCERTAMAAGAAALTLGLALAVLRSSREQPPAPAEPAAGERAPRWLVVLAAGAAAVASTGCLLYSTTRAHGHWDAWCMWIAKASLLHAPEPSWSQFLADLGTYEHPPYPFLIPGFLAQWMDVLGARSTAPPILVAMGFLAAIGFVAASTLARLRNGRAACHGVLALAGVHQIAQRTTDLAADIPLGFYLLATVALLQIGQRAGQRGPFLLAGACLGCATWTKNEGSLAFAAFLLAAPLGAAASGGMKRLGPRLVLLFLGAAPFLAMTWSFKLAVPALTDLVDAAVHQGSLRHLGDVGRYVPVVAKLGKEVLQLGNGLVLVLAALMLLSPKGSKPGVRWPAGALAVVFLGYVVVYITTPLDQDYHLITSTVRLLMHLAPATVFLLVLGTASPPRLLTAAATATRDH